MGLLSDLRQYKKQRKKAFGVLLDPDKTSIQKLEHTVECINNSPTDYILVGGSSMLSHEFHEWVSALKKLSKQPVISFPGSAFQLSNVVDATLLLSLVSGRNSDYLIGKHVEAAGILKQLKGEIISTAYYLIGNQQSTTAYITQTLPIPANKLEPLIATIWASELIGYQLHYFEGGSGSDQPISNETIMKAKEQAKHPIIVGGGITEPSQAYDIAKFGADMVVVGNVLELEPEAVSEFAFSVKSVESIL